MTSSPTTDSALIAELDARFTPMQVELQLHGASHTMTYLLDGRYYTVRNIQPDFPKIADDAKIEVVDRDSDEAKRIRSYAREIYHNETGRGLPAREKICEDYIVELLILDDEVSFGQAFRALLVKWRLDDIEVTNPSYYDAIKAFTMAWLRVVDIIRG